MVEGDGKDAILVKSKSVDDINLRNVHQGLIANGNGKVKHRRAKSVTRAENIQSLELKARKSQPDKP